MILGNFPAKVKPESGSLRRSGVFITHAVEFLKDSFLFFYWNAHTLIHDLQDTVNAFLFQIDGNRRTGRRVFNSIINEVVYEDLYEQRVAGYIHIRFQAL